PGVRGGTGVEGRPARARLSRRPEDHGRERPRGVLYGPMEPSLREKLVAAARDILAQDGYGAATPQAIAARAGVAPEAFTQTFAGRQEAVLAAIDAHWKDLSGFLDAAFASDVPPLDRLRRFTEGVYGFQDQQWSRLGCVVGCLLLRVGSAASR